MIKCSELNDSNIILTCDLPWSQEDIPDLIAQILTQYRDIQLLEQIEGADRVVVRLLWQHSHFCLHFECYSEAIWLDAEDDGAKMKLALLYQHLLGK